MSAQPIVKCPRCSRQLKVPPNANIFACPCGQHLRAPPSVSQQATPPRINQNTAPRPATTPQPTQVKCPHCSTILIPPPGAPIFRCRCGTTLRAPNVAAQQPTTPQPTVNNNAPANFQQNPPPPRPGNRTSTATNLINQARVNLPAMAGNLTNFFRRPQINNENPEPAPTPSKLTVTSIGGDSFFNVAGKTSETWLRNMGQGDKLYWVRILSPEQEEKIGKLLSTWENDMEKNIDELEEYDLKVRLEQLNMKNQISEDVEVMRKVLLGAKQQMINENNTQKLITILNALNVEHTACTSLHQYVERLMASVWYGPTRLCDGMVRQFVGEMDLTMVPAQSYGLALEHKLYGISSDTLETLSMASFKEKVAWFTKQCDKTRIPWEQGRVEMKIDRENILQDSFYKLNGFSPRDFHKIFKFTFISGGQAEAGIDAGGLAREWFELITDKVFHVDFGLFEYSGVDNICYQFNPGSGIANELHEEYFRFIGRFIGKALFDQKYINAHMTLPIFKHILGYPISVEDIQYCDEQIYSGLKQFEEMSSEDVDSMYLTFCQDYQMFGESLTYELKEGGEEISVTKANLQEYIGLMTKYFMLDRTKTQLAHFLKGIYDVVPELWLSIFDYRELELLLCGLPEVDIKDWKANSEYRGEFKEKGEQHKVVRWFWEYIDKCNQEQRARVLQFCTGTSRVPVAGFAALQGKEGTIQKFCLVAVPTSKFIYPRAHTCFNRLDLPLYTTRTEMVKRLEEAFSMNLTGFSDD